MRAGAHFCWVKPLQAPFKKLIKNSRACVCGELFVSKGPCLSRVFLFLLLLPRQTPWRGWAGADQPVVSEFFCFFGRPSCWVTKDSFVTSGSQHATVMIELSPTVIALILSVIISMTVLQYWVAPPMATDDAAAAAARGGSEGSPEIDAAKYNYYGVADGEFDWCEPNFEFSHLVAEPINTLSGALFFLPALAGFRHHRAKDLSMSTKLNLIFIAWIGVGTILFHATLRYTAQLIDEFPIYYVMVSGNYMLLSKGRPGGIPWLGWLFAAWSVALTTSILASDQDGSFHNAARGTMTVTFGVMFIHLFAGVASSLRALRARAESAAPATKSSSVTALAAVHSGQDLFQQTFFFFVLGIGCWIVDNAFCDHLHPEGWCALVSTCCQLHFLFKEPVARSGLNAVFCCCDFRLALPFYIQTHAIWHILSSAGYVRVTGMVCVTRLGECTFSACQMLCCCVCLQTLPNGPCVGVCLCCDEDSNEV